MQKHHRMVASVIFAFARAINVQTKRISGMHIPMLTVLLLIGSYASSCKNLIAN
jgi:hypothetical protein